MDNLCIHAVSANEQRIWARIHIMTTSEVAAHYQISATAINNAARRGTLRTVKSFNGTNLFLRADVDEWREHAKKYHRRDDK